jgi:uncharacterized protein (DUF433 family)
MTDLPEMFQRDADGQIRFRGHRIRLIDVVARYEEGHAPEAILVDFYPTLTLALVYRAIAFFLENETEIRALIAQNDRTVEALKARAPHTPGIPELRKRLEAKRRAEAS